MAVELRLDNIKWPKDFPELKALDDLLRCGICYGYIKTCMITSCSHNYCSLCIRKSMQYKTQCPTCFEETYESNLRNNRSFDQFVDLFSGIRDKLLRHLRIADLQLGQPQQSDDNLPSCIKFEQCSPLLTNGNIIKKIKCENSRLKHVSSAAGSPRTEINKPSVSRRLDGELISPPSHDDGLPTIPKMFLSPKKQMDTSKPKQTTDIPTVPCPVCGVDIPERNINIHLDNCLERSEKPIAKSPEKRKKRSPLAKMVYSMMSDKDLRKKLKEHGLNTHGDKKVLINRLQRFIVLYNSECDSDNPRPIADIIRQIEKEENGEKKSLGSLLVQPRLPAINRKTDPKIIEEENKKYIQENKDSFHALINAVRMRERRCPPKPARRSIIESDEEGPPKPARICIIESDEEDAPEVVEVNDEIEKIEQPPKVDRDQTLFDSSDDDLSEEYPSSPVLRSSKTPLRNNSFISKESTPQSNKGKEKTQGGSRTVIGVSETQELSCDSDSSAPSPSCIVPEYEDDISSLSSDSASEDNAETEELGAATEQYLKMNLKDSQIDDPDFSLNNTDLEPESEEIFVPSRRSRRKLPSPSPSNKCQTPVSQSKRKIKTPTSSGPESPVRRTLRKRAKR